MSGVLEGAVERLRSDGVLSEAQAAFLSRVARGELISVRPELQSALWVGVSLIAAGAGLLVKQHYREVGPLTVTLLLAAGTVAAFAYVARHAPPFSWRQVPAPTLAFEYLLLLGALLIGSDLAWAEIHWTALGTSWPWHLLVYALVLLPLAYRLDSGAVLSLALASVAAWRGVSLSLAARYAGAEAAATLRGNAILVGAAFVAAAALSRVSRRKPHFEPVYANLGLLLLFGGLLSGAFMGGGYASRFSGGWLAWLAALAAATAVVIPAAWRLRRASYFAIGVVAGWLGLIRLSVESRDAVGIAFFVAVTALAVVLLLLRVRRRFREEAR